MKRLNIIILVICTYSATLARTAISDTVILQLDNGQEVQIISPDNNEVDVLSSYDLNAIIDDLRTSMDSVGSDGEAIEVQDTAGTKYLGTQNTTNNNDNSLEQRIERLSRKVNWLTIELGDDDDDSKGDRASSSGKSRRTRNTGVFEFGLNNYLSNGRFPDENNALYAVKPVVSWYVALGMTNRTQVAGPLHLDWGANVSWYNFKFENERTRLEKTDTGVRFFEGTNVSEPIKSKLVVPYLNVSFVPMLRLGGRKKSDHTGLFDNKDGGFWVGAGVYAGYRLGSRAKYVFREDDDRTRVKERTNFYVNNWRYGVRAQMGFRGLSLFASYDLNELFVEERGPELNAFSFGIVI